MKKLNIALLCMALFSGMLSTASSEDTNSKWGLNIDVINKTKQNSEVLFSAITTWIVKQVKKDTNISTETKHISTKTFALKSISNTTTLHRVSFLNTLGAQLKYQLQLGENGAKSPEFAIEKNCISLKIDLNADGTVKCTRQVQVAKKPIAKL